ncbi:MAG: methanogenesis marker protein Mmp4/MtxX [Methanobrevibacter sp.]|uniref:methanogenesis marker protein Mmp4/MtxX n=1 Tax=Methanobrevibacter sp. TaxID=66852 RepID=UPI002601327F|nr:methanogenesis marker protein Mmp4/MtxX [Methanobrevibacter sp.]MBQ6100090.1 methanogenesis marker protein Mmp4/MtxX [Methanobrevibacter sp.]
MKKIAIGIGKNQNISKAIELFEKNHDAKIIYIDNDEDLAKAILDNEIDAVVRGSLPASNVIKNVKKHFPNISRATYVNGDGKEFLLTPVGIDEGTTVDEKLEIAVNCAEFLKKLSKEPKIAVLADGRKGDYGRSEKISKSIDESEKLTQLIKENTDFEVKNYYILIEQALKNNCNVIIAPDGIIGNIIFRTLILVNSWPSCGAITFGINGIYIDTSRDQTIEGYLRSIKFAYKLANL